MKWFASSRGVASLPLGLGVRRWGELGGWASSHGSPSPVHILLVAVKPAPGIVLHTQQPLHFTPPETCIRNCRYLTSLPNSGRGWSTCTRGWSKPGSSRRRESASTTSTTNTARSRRLADLHPPRRTKRSKPTTAPPVQTPNRRGDNTTPRSLSTSWTRRARPGLRHVAAGTTSGDNHRYLPWVITAACHPLTK